MKQLFRNNYIQIDAIKGIVLGVGTDSSNDLIVLLGPIVITIHSYMFKRRRKVTKSKYDIEVF
jgi:hypothetical protein